MNKSTYLVVGGDSRVGRELVKSLEYQGNKVYSTTRRIDQVSKNKLYLNYEDIDDFSIPNDVDYAYIIAAISNYQECELDKKSFWINVEVIPKLVSLFLNKKIFTSFISTNSVFGGKSPWPEEYHQHSPNIAYAKQKSEAENRIKKIAINIKCENIINIIRITKILDKNTPPIPDWIQSWNLGDSVAPFSDLIFCPMSSKFVGNSLARLGQLRISGNLHLSGEKNISYTDFALLLAKHLDINLNLIKSTTATECNVNIAFKPKYSGISMLRTTSLSQIYPQNINSVIHDIFDVNGVA